MTVSLIKKLDPVNSKGFQGVLDAYYQSNGMEDICEELEELEEDVT